MRPIFAVACAILLFPVACFSQENQSDSFTIVTYYPSPYGVYRNLRLFPSQQPTGANAQPGTMYFNATTNTTCVFVNATDTWQPVGGGTWKIVGTNIVNANAGNVGIGMAAPATALEVAQNKAIKVGEAYLSSGVGYLHLSQNEWYTGSSWQAFGLGALLQMENGNINFYTQLNGANTWLVRMLANGNVGIGTTTPTEKLEVAGNVKAVGFFYSSDRSLKSEILPLTGSLDRVRRLQGMSFRWTDGDRRDIGLIAQDVEKVYPELVTTDRSSGLKSVEYGNLVAVLIEAVKEQQAQIQGLKVEMDRLKR